MGRSSATLAVAAVLIAAVSFPALARGHSGGGRSHASSGAHAPAVHAGPSRHYAGRAAVGVFVGTAVMAPLLMSAPRYYYAPPPRYVAPLPAPAYWYYCPQLQAYYPYVQECPGQWQPVVPQPSY